MGEKALGEGERHTDLYTCSPTFLSLSHMHMCTPRKNAQLFKDILHRIIRVEQTLQLSNGACSHSLKAEVMYCAFLKLFWMTVPHHYFQLVLGMTKATDRSPQLFGDTWWRWQGFPFIFKVLEKKNPRRVSCLLLILENCIHTLF